MLDVYVQGTYAPPGDKPAFGVWYCPAMNLYGVTHRAAAVDENDGVRVGCALAILSAFNQLGDELAIHVASEPAPRWVTQVNRTPPIRNVFYRALYQMEIHPRIKKGTIVPVVEVNLPYRAELDELIKTGEVHVCTA